MNSKFVCLFLAIASISASAGAEVVRCTGPDGKVSYSDYACPKASSAIKAVDVSHTQSPGQSLSYVGAAGQSGGQYQAGNADAGGGAGADTMTYARSVTYLRHHVVVVAPNNHEHSREQTTRSATPNPAPSAAPRSSGGSHGAVRR